MHTGYFSAAWQDIKNSPGWFGKLVLLSLLSLVPIFGWLVVLGYLYGWARDIAWNVRGPLPKRIFGNEDGRLYSRGFFALVIGFVCMLAPMVLETVWGAVTGTSVFLAGRAHGGAFLFFGVPTMVFALLVVGAMFFATLFLWVGSMRMSVYGRLGAGFQFDRIWAMIRRDFAGLLRILAVAVALTLLISIVASIFIFVVVLFGVLIGLATAGGGMAIQASHPGASVSAAAFAAGGFAVVFAVLASVLGTVALMFVEMIAVRALGYWTRQFDVPAWRGQEDPLPFELAAASGYPPAQQPPPSQQPPHAPPAQQPPHARQPPGAPPAGRPPMQG